MKKLERSLLKSLTGGYFPVDIDDDDEKCKNLGANCKSVANSSTNTVAISDCGKKCACKDRGQEQGSYCGG